jgi:flagellin
MTISIQGTNSALSALETLAALQGGHAAGGTSAASQSAQTAPTTDSAATILSVSSGSAAPSLFGPDLATTASASDAAVASGSAIESLLTQMQQDAQSASDPSLSDGDRATLDANFQSGLAALGEAVSGASVDGLNLIDGSAGAASGGTDFSAGGSVIGLGANASLSDPTSAAAIAGQLGSAIGNVGQAVGQIAARGQAITDHMTVVAQAALSLQPGLSAAINGNLDADGANLAALQVQQTLSTSSGSIAGQSQSAILAMFR